MGTPEMPVDVRRIQEMLPHRYPFLMIDRVIEFEPGKRLVGLKNVTINEPFFEGHFPGHPVMPGVLILEALAQASGVLVQLSAGEGAVENPLYYLVKIDKARFSQVVKPGDQLRLEVEQTRMRLGMGQFLCQARVDGKVVASAEVLCAARGPQ
ncbi:MAG: 3-hydroxyacyl-ACP dehydratase FabZ [Xanthomonadales bacterium]|nr:3-hydroxyacyl-ACP dehydratase FabZ [Xanthomonadales bacterium]MCB1633262.1 3-hydroxyacyl-ACP dehydratase FabZ [Xanthomonadales bacterium]